MIRRIGTLGKIGTIRSWRVRMPDLPETPSGKRLLDPRSEREREWSRLVGPKRAKSLMRLVASGEGLGLTLPELCAYLWLKRRKLLFEYQSPLLGGRLQVGGAVADFVIYDLLPGGLVLWRIMGDYWHGTPTMILRDREQKERLARARYNGLPVHAVVDLWESAIYVRYPFVFLRAEGGEEIGRAI